MNHNDKTQSINDEIAQLSIKISQKRYRTAEEKHELQKKKWLLGLLLREAENKDLDLLHT